MTCSKVAFALSVLGMVGILSMGVVTLFSGRLHFGSIWWRLSWWASWLSFLVGIALLAFFCGSPTNHLAFGAGEGRERVARQIRASRRRRVRRRAGHAARGMSGPSGRVVLASAAGGFWVDCSARA